MILSTLIRYSVTSNKMTLGKSLKLFRPQLLHLQNKKTISEAHGEGLQEILGEKPSSPSK